MIKQIEKRRRDYHRQEYQARLSRMHAEMQAGFKFLERFDRDRVVSIFGSAQIRNGDPLYRQAMELGRMLAEEGITVVTGGGPGLMEAANRGAYDAGGRSVGINIYLRTQERQNPYLNERIGFHYFFVRKLILAHIAQAYVYFPGGFGTLDEFFEISTLVATKKIEQKMPIVLYGKTYWNSLQRFLEKTAVEKYETLSKEKVRLWTITDSITEAFEIVRKIPRRIIRSEDV